MKEIDWVIFVLADLEAFARENHLENLEAILGQARDDVALELLASKACPSTPKDNSFFPKASGH